MKWLENKRQEMSRVEYLNEQKYMVGIARIQKKALIDRQRFTNSSSFKEMELH